MTAPNAHPTRREFLRLAAGGVAAVGLGLTPPQGTSGLPSGGPGRSFRVWCFGDAHVGTDARHGCDDLATALRQSEEGGPEGAPPIDWDLALNVGDDSGPARWPTDEEGRDVLVPQYKVLKKHRREQIYNVSGNHDRSLDNGAWFRRWSDPLGEHTGSSGVDARQRPYPVEGTWERYAFRAGNLLFLLMSDVLETTHPDYAPLVTLRGQGKIGGLPGGVVSADTVAWFKDQVLGHPDALVIAAHHYVLRQTTVASGDYEGFRRLADGRYASKYHGYSPAMGEHAKGASYLYWQAGQAGGGSLDRFLAEHSGRVALWIGGHTHARPGDQMGGRSHIETACGGTHFINCAALTRFHAASGCSVSRLLTFTEGSTDVRVQCYVHHGGPKPSDAAAAADKVGWYPPEEKVLRLPRVYHA
ncbi:MAG: metallophosphoesterase [Planctomycetes bacterium]|nr:metallophosphoesterase [Planctomycetota bacterium]